MTKNQRAKKILEILDDHYPKEVICFLDHTSPYELLIATILSAQCTDARVNIVTKDLFARYTSLEAFANAEISEMESYVKSTGFYRMKAKNIIACCQKLISDFDGKVPDNIEDLTSLAGVGRKTANVILSNIYNVPSVVVDTHIKRISTRWGLTEKEDPTAIEYDLMKVLPKDHWIRYNTQVITHGREICQARGPKCDQCFFLAYCPFGLEERLRKLGWG